MRTTDVLRSLFSDPLDALTEAEADYRRIWARWIRRTLDLLELADDEPIPEHLLTTAPVLDLNGQIDLAVTLRVSSTRSSGGEVGLELASFPLTGGFSFSSQRTEESVFKARASFTVTHAEADLPSYLDRHRIAPTSVGELRAAADRLEAETAPDAENGNDGS